MPWIDPETQIEHDQDKRTADMNEEKAFARRAYAKMNAWRDALEGYKSGIRDEAVVEDAEKLALYEYEATKAAQEFMSTDACCLRRAARIDFINAALAKQMTDLEILKMLLPAMNCRYEDETTAILRGLVADLGGKITDLYVD